MTAGIVRIFCLAIVVPRSIQNILKILTWIFLEMTAGDCQTILTWIFLGMTAENSQNFLIIQTEREPQFGELWQSSEYSLKLLV